MQNLSWQYPSWYLGLCLLAGVGASFLLYYKDRTFSDQPAWLRYLMAILRGLVVTVLASLLLAPLLKLLQNRVEPPVIILAQDQSESIRTAFSKNDSTTYLKSLDDLYNRLSGKFVVHRIGFGQEVRELKKEDPWVMTDKASDLGEFMTYVQQQYRGQNVGAVIVASDGAINRGKNPLYVPLSQKAPLYVVALGDTIRKTDLQVKDVINNSIAYLGDKFSLQIDLAAVRLQGATTTLEIKHILDNKDELLESTPITIDADPWFMTKDVILEATESGVQHYRVQLSQVKNEVTYTNNVRDFFVEVIDGRLNVLLIANSPHPDLAVWKAALLSQRNYEVDIRMAPEVTPDQLKKYDLVIFHQLPSVKNPVQALLNELDKKGTPRIFIAGYQTDLVALSHAQPFLNITSGGDRTPNDVTTVINPSFNLFNLSEDARAKISSFSPLQSPYGEYTAAPSAQVMSYQKIGAVDTQYPLIIMGEADEKRTCIVAGEGVWRWQLYDQLQNGSRDITYEILNQICQYTSTKSDKRKFRVNTSKRLYTELEDISFQAELYNDSYELINTPEVSIKIRNPHGDDFDYTFNTLGQSYVLQVGRFPDGNYSWTASTDVNGVHLTSDGKFVVQPVQLETLETTADHGLLRQLAAAQGGRLFNAQQLTELGDKIMGDDQIKPVMYSTTQTRPLIHLKWLCLILLASLSLEWFLRRYYGGY